MKPLNLIFCAGILTLSSCSSYHYVTPLPAVPQFEKAGDMQAQVALGTNHIEYQASVSPINHLGFTYNGFRGYGSTSKMNSYTLHSYWGLGQKKAFFLTGSVGYDEAELKSKVYEIPSAIDNRSITHYSEYKSYRLGIGAYYNFGEEERQQISLDMHYQQSQFSQLTTLTQKHYVPGPDSWEYSQLLGKPKYHVISPLLTFTITGSNHGLFYYRQSIGCNIVVNTGEMTMATSRSMEPAGTPPEISAFMPRMSYLVASGTVGMRLKAIDLLFRKKNNE